MRAKDDLRKQALRMVLAAIKQVEIDGHHTTLDDAGVMAVLQKEIKTRQETIAEAQKANRPAMIAEKEAEIEIIKAFLPQSFSPAELEALVRQVIAEVGASAPGDMGKVMKALTPRLQGRATNAEASQMVRALLQ